MIRVKEMEGDTLRESEEKGVRRGTERKRKGKNEYKG